MQISHASTETLSRSTTSPLWNLPFLYEPKMLTILIIKTDIQYTYKLFLNIKGLIQKITLHDMTCKKENVILGLPWLKKANSSVNWSIQTLAFDESIDKSQELYHCHTIDTAWHSSYYWPIPRLSNYVHVDMVKENHLGSYLNQETESQYIHHALNNCAIHQIIRCGSCFSPMTPQ